ncbi:hypothetical protein [Streptomyces sp. Isolate_45]|uniref:hypothetical protein n=1 Tax=unclassified Streptomyces TaxID=2593676 RepID=UPI002481E391|nr:hypothetical protein [Streptomyces sp. Isolate_45]MDA5282181.1 hypothetical protein [Streptomyces sp. Isolate_45]
MTHDVAAPVETGHAGPNHEGDGHRRPNGSCRFTGWGTGRVGSVTPDGKITEHPLTAPDREPNGLAFARTEPCTRAAEERGRVSRWKVRHAT